MPADPAAATIGTWDFASTTQANSGTQSIEALNMSDGDIATISKGSDLDFSGYVSITGFVYITRFNATQQEALLFFCDDAVLVGNSVNIMDYVDSSTLNTWQKFTILKADFGISDVNVDALKIEFVASHSVLLFIVYGFVVIPMPRYIELYLRIRLASAPYILAFLAASATMTL